MESCGNISLDFRVVSKSYIGIAWGTPFQNKNKTSAVKMSDESQSDFPSPEILREAILNHLEYPVVFRNHSKSLNLPNIMESCGNISLDFRVVSKSYIGIAWENSGDYVEASVSEFSAWQRENFSHLSETNPFYKFPKENYWAYSSYNYMKNVFPEGSDILKVLNWNAFGFPEVAATDCAFWIGSCGSYTPCHFDSYGCNLVAQIEGRKRWVLFPPTDDSFMYPSRIPYEESSVFSSVNIKMPNYSVHPLFKESHPYVAVLNPGDVLFVPKKWWHFVESLDTTISINAWLKLDSDRESRLEESVIRILMNNFISMYEPEGECWLNLKEELLSTDKTIDYMTSALEETKQQNQYNSSSKEEPDVHLVKSIKVSKESNIHSTHSYNNILKHNCIELLKPVPFTDIFYENSQEKDSSYNKTSIENVINCFVHPDVISVICNKLKSL
ncbi:HSPB1-associated protein 1-like [Uloborus diversus]|uniref:HSPB1-associated protein 1-like n=1 Tax=Uloborus diversus TaxID=327109 RepID=UPI00240A78F8|nr:HSPB1-associated protein 1-like [Uloborus diversus]